MVSGHQDFFINMKDVPRWDRTKNYWEQPIDTILFFENEWEKIKNGLVIDGVFIHPWLYFHLNYFKTPIPVKQKNGEIEDEIMNPSFRDNEWYFAETLIQAKQAGKAIFLFGSRRFSKSSLEVSFLQWNAITKSNSTSEIICGGAIDLSVVSRFLRVSHTNIHPFLYLPTNKKDWAKHVQYGVKEGKTEDPLVHSDIFIKNADAGKESASEKGAGGAPSAVIIDEAGKFSFLSLYLSLLPAISTPEGLKATVILSGTSGNEKLSKDAFKVLANPEAYKILPMNWDTFESRIDPEAITWKRRSFAMFVPAQMAYEEGVIKLESNLASYLKNPSEALSKIKINVTDWKPATNIFLANRKKLENDKEALAKEVMYHPLDPDDCLMSGTINPFPVQEARIHLQDIMASGDIGKAVDLYRKDDGTLGYNLSAKKRIKFPFEGGIHDAPVVLFEEPPTVKPAYGENTSGVDPYKAAESSGDSAGAMYVLGRCTDITIPIETIKASYVTRPKITNVFYRNNEMLIEGWNAECLMENADQGFLQYLDGKHKAESLLADGVDWSKLVNPSANPKTSLGFSPTPKNNEYLFRLAVDYAWTEVQVGIDAAGEPIIRLGVTFIKDPELLQEMIDWKEKGNFDRLRAFGAALAWARHLDKLNIQPRREKVDAAKRSANRDKAKRAAIGAIPLIKKRN